MINYVKTPRKNLLDMTKPDKTYAVAQSRDNMDLNALAEHVASHGCTYDAGDVIAVTKKVVRCMRELLLDGYIINLGDLGTFLVRLKSKGIAESVPDSKTGEKPVFSASDITAVNVEWIRSEKFDNMLDDASFNEVDSLKAQSDSLKAKNAQLAAGTYGSSSTTTGSSDEPVDNE